jgi:hypothetical protein
MALETIIDLLGKKYSELEVKRAKTYGFVQGCQNVSRELQNELQDQDIKTTRCIITTPYGPFENSKTGDYIHYHFFLVYEHDSDIFAIDPFVSSKPIELTEYLRMYDGSNLHVGIPNKESFVYIGFEKFVA